MQISRSFFTRVKGKRESSSTNWPLGFFLGKSHSESHPEVQTSSLELSKAPASPTLLSSLSFSHLCVSPGETPNVDRHSSQSLHDSLAHIAICGSPEMINQSYMHCRFQWFGTTSSVCQQQQTFPAENLLSGELCWRSSGVIPGDGLIIHYYETRD